MANQCVEFLNYKFSYSLWHLLTSNYSKHTHIYIYEHTHTCVCVCVCVCCSVMSNSLQLYGMSPVRLHRILQARILESVAIPFSEDLPQGLNLHLLHILHCILYHLSYQGSPEKEKERERLQNALKIL